MKARNVQFGERKNPDSSRVHGLRLAVRSLPVESVRKLESTNGAELTPPPAPYEAGWPQLPHSGLPNKATGGTETGRDRLLTVEEVAVLSARPCFVGVRPNTQKIIRATAGLRLGKYWRFREDEVLAWLVSHGRGHHAS